jgi:hypothetical protein
VRRDVCFGSLADISGPCGHVGFASDNDKKADIDYVGFVPTTDIDGALFDHFVGAAEQWKWHLKS